MRHGEVAQQQLEPARLAGSESDRHDRVMKHDAFVACRRDFFGDGQQQVIVDVDRRTLAPGSAGSVNRRVATADDGDAGAEGRCLAGAHLVQVVEAGENAGAVFAGNLQLPLLPGAGGQIHGVEAVQFRPGHVPAEANPGVHPDAERVEYLELSLQHLRRQTVFSDRPAQHAADFGKRFIDLDAIAEAREVVGCRQPRGAAADHGHRLAQRLPRHGESGGGTATVAGHALDGIDRQGAIIGTAIALALARVRADAPERRRERMFFIQHPGGFAPVVLGGQRHQPFDVVAGRASLGAGRQAVLVARHPLRVERREDSGRTRARAVVHLDGYGCAVRAQPFQLRDAGIAGEDHGDAAMLRAAVIERVQQHAPEGRQIVGVGVLQVVDAAAPDQRLEVDHAAAVAIGGYAEFGRRLHAGHAGGAVVQHQQDEARAVVDRVLQSGGARVKERAVADGGENRRRFSVLGVGMVEARCHGNGCAHVVHRIDRALVQAKGVATYVAGENGLGECPPQRVEDGPVPAAGTERRAANGQFESGHGDLHAIGGAFVRRAGRRARGRPPPVCFFFLRVAGRGLVGRAGAPAAASSSFSMTPGVSSPWDGICPVSRPHTGIDSLICSSTAASVSSKTMRRSQRSAKSSTSARGSG